MKRTLIVLAVLALVIAPIAMAKPPPGKGNNGKPKKPTVKPEKPAKVCLESEGWVELAEDAVERGMLKLNAESKGKLIAAAKGCTHRKTILQASCSKPGPVPPGVTVYQYRAMEQYYCRGPGKKVSKTFFARSYTPAIPTPVV